MNKFLTAKAFFIYLIITFLLLFVTNGVPYIYSDGYASYHISHSVVNKASFVSEEKPEYFDYRGHVISLQNEVYNVVYAPGAGLLNIPGNFIAKVIEGNKTIYNDYFKAVNGHTFSEGVMYLITAMIFGIATIVLLYKALRNLGYSEKVSILATLSGYISSYAVWYVFLNSAFSHTYELFGITLAIFGYSKLVKSNKYIDAVILGAGVGIATICRPVLAFTVVLFAIYFLINKRYKHLVYYALGGIPSAILLMWYNYISYGKLIASGYDEVRGETFTFDQFNGLNILFSEYRGWFIYSPAFLIGVIGLFFLYRKSKFLSLVSLASIASLVVIYGFWPSWWAGGSYGHRFMIPAMPFATIGIAHSLMLIANKLNNSKPINFKKLIQFKYNSISSLMLLFFIVFTVWTLMLTVMYRFTPVAELKPFSDREGRMNSGDRYTPTDIIDYQLDLVRNASGPKGYIKDLIDSGNGGTSFIPVIAGFANPVIRLDERTPGVIKFSILETPFIKDDKPLSVWFYFYEINTTNLYSVEIYNFDTISEFSINCLNGICESRDSNVVLTKVTGVNQFKRTEYIAVQSEANSVQMFFPNTVFDVFFKGSPINLPDAEEYYKI